MKRVLILQHVNGDGPAFLATWLQREGIVFDVRNTEAGDTYPSEMREYSALAVLGGYMSANDCLPSLRRAEVLIRDAMQRDRPVIGHCLGGQLMARALGARVGASAQPEIGWHPIRIERGPAARQWFGDAEQRTVFQWHREAFEVPAHALSLGNSASCRSQAFAIGPHLAMQFHIEVDLDKLDHWWRLIDARDRDQALYTPTIHFASRLGQSNLRALDCGSAINFVRGN